MNKEKKIVKTALEYIYEKSTISTEKLEYYLNEWKYRKPKSLEDTFESLLNSAQNSGGMPNFIGKVKNLRPFLYDFSPKKVVENYENWESLFDTINISDYKTPSQMIKTNKRNSWVKYCKSIIDCAKFLSKFENLDSFTKYVNQFVNKDNSDLRIALPLIIKEEIFNIGFALACDFIKDNISPKFAKPDTHINKIFIGISYCNAEDSNFDIFRKVITFSDKAEKEPFWIDKLFWLIGSGYCYANKKYPEREELHTNRTEFIGVINKSH